MYTMAFDISKSREGGELRERTEVGRGCEEGEREAKREGGGCSTLPSKGGEAIGARN
jgi:hypothetical protein